LRLIETSNFSQDFGDRWEERDRKNFEWNKEIGGSIVHPICNMSDLHYIGEDKN
jgi:hypothetical protein